MDESSPVTLGTLKTRLQQFDHVRFGVCCRKIVVCCIQGRLDAARLTLQEFLQKTQRLPVNYDASVHEVLPARIAEALARGGYETLGAACAATDEQLSSLGNFGPLGVAKVRAAGEAAADGQLYIQDEPEECPPDGIEQFCLELRHWAEGMALETTTTTPHAPEHTMPTQTHVKLPSDTKPSGPLEGALDQLLDAGEDALQMIDLRIEALRTQIARLQRARRLLAGSQTSPPSRKGPLTPDLVAAVEQIVSQHGPLRPSEIASRLEGDVGYAMVGKAIVRSNRLCKLPDGRVQSVLPSDAA